MNMKTTAKEIFDHLTKEHSPEVALALVALRKAEKGFVLLVWDDDTDAAAVLANASPSTIINLLRQTTDKIVEAEAERSAAAQLAAPKH